MAALAVAVSACAVDDRAVAVRRLCQSAPADGLLSDFSAARLGLCVPPSCTGSMQGSPTVSLGTTGVYGLFFSYRVPRHGTLALGLTGDLDSTSDARSALRVVMNAGVVDPGTPPLLGAFAARFGECLDLSGFANVSFRIEGDVGACALRVGPQLIARDDDQLGAPCPLDECPGSTPVGVTTGLTTVPLPSAQPGRVLAGLQWELDLPPAAATCAADFTLDDLRLDPSAARP